MRRPNLAISLIAVLSLGFTQGCATYAHPRPATLPPGAEVTITTRAEPFTLLFAAAGGSTGPTTCRASRVTGYSTKRSADTVHLAWISAVTPAVRGDSACLRLPVADVVTHGSTWVNYGSREVDDFIKIIAVVGITVGVLAYLSQLSPPLVVRNPNMR